MPPKKRSSQEAKPDAKRAKEATPEKEDTPIEDSDSDQSVVESEEGHVAEYIKTCPICGNQVELVTKVVYELVPHDEEEECSESGVDETDGHSYVPLTDI